MKVLNELYNKYKDSGFVFVAISIDDQKSLSKVKPYIESKVTSFLYYSIQIKMYSTIWVARTRRSRFSLTGTAMYLKHIQATYRR